MNKASLALVLVAFLVSSCKKDLVGFSKDLTVDNFGFEYFAARARVSYSDGNQNINAIANIRMKKDSVIWLSVSKLGVEGARMLVRRDSIFVLDRLKKRYSARSLQQLSNQLRFDVDYHLIESVVLGNLIFPYEQEDLYNEGGYVQYLQEIEKFAVSNFIGTRTRKLEKLIVEDTSTKNTISVNYGDFQEIESEIFPFNIAALVKYAQESKDDINITIGFSRAEVRHEPLRFPFGAPAKYTRI